MSANLDHYQKLNCFYLCPQWKQIVRPKGQGAYCYFDQVKMRPLILFFWHKSMLPSVSSCTLLVRDKVRYIWTLLEPTTSESTARQMLLFFVVSFSSPFFTDHTNQVDKFKCSMSKVWYFVHLQCIWSESLKLFFSAHSSSENKRLKTIPE